MNQRHRFWAGCGVLLAAMAALGLGGCQVTPRVPGPEAAAYATISPMELRDILAGLARSHEQKMQLVLYLSLPWGGVDPAFRDFFNNMAPVQQGLYTELRTWARTHDIDLTFKFGDDVLSKAQETMEDRQQKVIMADNRTDLTRDTLIQMWADYEWQVSVLQNLLPTVREPGLKAYVEKSLKAHEAGSAEITKLLKRFKGS